MRLRRDEYGWICSRMEGEMLHKNVEIRSNWKIVANGGKESGIWGWSRLCDEGRIGRDVLQVICTLFLKTNQRKTRKIRDLSTLT